MRAVLLALSLLASGVGPGGREADRYATGQVWEYRTRPGEEGSLLKIQAIEHDAAAIRGSAIYHISIIGLHLKDPQLAPVLAHTPVSRTTLDTSVTRLRADAPAFPDAGPGIAQWRSARGGVYTTSVAEIVAGIDEQTAPPTPPM